ncbi:ABC transporter ATP-binding protein [Pseudomonas typographi]|uniref:ABC transporter ATP-binding protein n=1 Tax=Pseudomonas typographi TaxID=2715964 RepID=A0ABR7Z4B3_9PSED|nr:ABC transporter ATP-binding protein [Pseudomonas typographi]MBD1600126.1 ABC transporter ATP-binding protein [Pseudomonas typographi]
MSTLLTVTGVTKAFAGNAVLQGVDFAIGPGEIVGVIGPNGSGKSTLLNAISGFTPVDAGRIELGGAPLQRLAPHRIHGLGLARTFQLPAMPEKMTVFEVLLAADNRRHGFWASLCGGAEQRAQEAASRALATQWLGELLLTGVRDTPAAALSGGQKKLLSVGCALMGNPRLLMLDEPTAGVHPNLRRDMVAMLQGLAARGIALLIVEHDMHFIGELCQRCIVLDRGRVVAQCTPAQLSQHPQVLQAYLGSEHPVVLEAAV